MPCKEEEDEVNRWSSESRVKLAGLCRNIVQTRAETSLLGYAECSRYSTKLIVTEEDKVNLRHALQRRGETDVWANRNHGYTA